MQLANFRLGTRLGAAFAILLAITLAVGAFARFEIGIVHGQAEELATDWLPSVEAAGQLRATTGKIREAEALMAFGSGEQSATALRDIASLSETLAADEDRYRKLISTDAERTTFAQYDALREKLAAGDSQMRKLLASGNQMQAAALFFGSTQQAYGAVTALFERLIEINRDGASQAHRDARSAYDRAVTGLLLALAVATVFALCTSVVITRSITRPVAAARLAAERVASGDLTTALVANGRDEVAQLLQALAAMQDRLSTIVNTVRMNSEGVATASVQIAHGNTDLSQRTEEQASALQQTAATMEQLGGTVRHNADNAQQASQLAQNASQVASQGGTAVGQVVDTMQRIHAGSARISDITGVIDGIAFQTNILALNAAVEAARAGDQGRGFAVVAGEVRALAQRSSAAAKEIKELITASAAQIQEGSERASAAGATMQDVVQAIRRVTDIAAEISAASKEQSHGMAEIGQAVSQMDQVTQQNAALVEESAAAAESLKAQAQQLVQLVAVFKLSEANALPMARRASALPGKSSARAPMKVERTQPVLAGAATSEWSSF